MTYLGRIEYAHLQKLGLSLSVVIVKAHCMDAHMHGLCNRVIDKTHVFNPCNYIFKTHRSYLHNMPPTHKLQDAEISLNLRGSSNKNNLSAPFLFAGRFHIQVNFRWASSVLRHLLTSTVNKLKVVVNW